MTLTIAKLIHTYLDIFIEINFKIYFVTLGYYCRLTKGKAKLKVLSNASDTFYFRI